MLAREDQQRLLLIDMFVRAGRALDTFIAVSGQAVIEAVSVPQMWPDRGSRVGDGAKAKARSRPTEVLRRPEGLRDRMLKLLTLGFEVRELMGGFDWWKRDGYATEGARTQAGTEIVCGC